MSAFAWFSVCLIGVGLAILAEAARLIYVESRPEPRPRRRY